MRSNAARLRRRRVRLTGGLLAALWSSIVGPEQANGEVVVAMTLACATCGALLGAMRNRKE